MGFIFSPPKPKLPPAPPPLPTQADPGVQKAAEQARRRALRARGRGSTILTEQPLGATAGAVEPKTLLGG